MQVKHKSRPENEVLDMFLEKEKMKRKLTKKKNRGKVNPVSKKSGVKEPQLKTRAAKVYQ